MNEPLEKMAAYIAENNPRGVNKVAYKYGYLPPLSQETREGFIFQGFMENGDDFLRDLALVHPDRELIVNATPLNADGYVENVIKEPNRIDLKDVTSMIPVVKENSDTIRIIIIAAIAYIIYKVLS